MVVVRISCAPAYFTGLGKYPRRRLALDKTVADSLRGAKNKFVIFHTLFKHTPKTSELMARLDLYRQFGMDELFRGDCFEIGKDDSSRSAIQLLDKVCVQENLKPLGNKWREISYEEIFRLLFHALFYDLAYSTCELMTREKALFFQQKILSRVSKNNCVCYTNWTSNPWNDKSGAYWNPITESTFDMAIVFIDSNKIIFSYFESED